MTPNRLALGQHWLADFYGVHDSIIQTPEALENLLIESANLAGATVLNAHMHHFGESMGVTGVLVLAESHISVHTWPEHGFLALDVFMCGHANPKRAIDYIQHVLAPKEVNLTLVQRGGPLCQAQKN